MTVFRDDHMMAGPVQDHRGILLIDLVVLGQKDAQARLHLFGIGHGNLGDGRRTVRQLLAPQPTDIGQRVEHFLVANRLFQHRFQFEIFPFMDEITSHRRGDDKMRGG